MIALTVYLIIAAVVLIGLTVLACVNGDWVFYEALPLAVAIVVLSAFWPLVAVLAVRKWIGRSIH